MVFDLLLSDEVFAVMQPPPQLSSVVDDLKVAEENGHSLEPAGGQGFGLDTRLPSFSCLFICCMCVCGGCARISECYCGGQRTT